MHDVIFCNMYYWILEKLTISAGCVNNLTSLPSITKSLSLANMFFLLKTCLLMATL